MAKYAIIYDIADLYVYMISWIAYMISIILLYDMIIYEIK